MGSMQEQLLHHYSLDRERSVAIWDAVKAYLRGADSRKRCIGVAYALLLLLFNALDGGSLVR